MATWKFKLEWLFLKQAELLPVKELRDFAIPLKFGLKSGSPSLNAPRFDQTLRLTPWTKDILNCRLMLLISTET
jgi:hypothetical protein